MAESIDKLQIEIEAQAQSATSSIDSLAEKLSTLQNGIDSLDLEKLNDLNDDIGNLSNLGESLSSFGNAVSGLENLSTIADGITKISNAVENIPSSTAFEKLSSCITALNNAETSSLSTIADNIDRLSESLSALRDQNTEDLGINGPSDEDVENTANYATRTEELTEAVQEATAAIDELDESLKKVGSSTEQVEGVKQSVSKISEEANKSGEIVINFGDILTNSFKSIGHSLSEIGSSLRKTGLGALSSILSGAAKGASNLGSKVLTATKNLAKMALQSTPIAKIGNAFDSLGRAADNLEAKLAKVVRLFTMMVLRTTFRNIFDQLTTSFQQLAKYSDRVNVRVSALMSSLNQLAHSITAVAKPLLEIFGPALTYIINLLNTAINYVNQFIAAFTGKTYTTGSYVGEDYAGSLEDAADAADDATEAQKKLNKQLQGFNELNNLTTTDTSSTSSGSGSTDLGDTGGYYEDLPIEQDILDFVNKLKQAWEDADFTEIGNILGQKLKDALENIPWDEIQESAQKLAHSLATLINGFVETEGLGETIGNTIGEAINTALIFADEFLTTIHWDSVGEFLADILNGAVESINWELLGQTLGDAIAAWLEVIYTTITNFNWEDLGDELAKSINNFVDKANEALTSYDWAEVGKDFANGINHLLDGVEWDDLGELFANGFNAILNSLSGAIATFDYASLGKDLAEAMNAAFEKIEWGEIGTTIKNGVNGAITSIKNWAENFDFESAGKDIAEAINNALSGINWEEAITAAEDIGSGIAKAIKNCFTSDTFKNLGSTIAGLLNTAIAGVSSFLDDTNFYQLGLDVADGINQFLADMDYKELGRTLGKVIQSAINFLSGLISGLSWSDVKSALEEFFEGMGEEVDMGKLGAILAAALGAWILVNFVSGVISAIGTGLGLKLALEISGLMGGEITASAFAGVVGVIAAALGEALFQMTVDDITGGPEGLVNGVSGVIESACEKLDGLSEPGGALYEFGEKLESGFRKVWNATLGKLGLTLPDNETDETPEGEAYTFEAEIEVSADEESVERTKQYLAGSFPAETYVTISEDIIFTAQKLIDNIDDEDKVIKCIGDIYKAIFDETLSDTQIKGLTGIIDKLEAEGQLEVGNVIASVYAYGKLVELQDDLDDQDKIIETAGELVELFLGDNAKNYDVEGLTGELVELIASGADPVDVIGEIVDFMVKNGITAQSEVEVTDFIYNHEERVALEGEVYKLIMDINENDSANRPELIGNVSRVIFGDEVTQAQIDGVTAIVDKLENTGNLSIESVMAYVEAYGKLVELQDNLDDQDKVVDTIGEIVQLVTGGVVDDYVVEGLQGKIEELITSGAEPVEIIGEIIDFLVANGVLAQVDVEGYIKELIDDAPDKERQVELLGEIYKLITGSEASNTVIDDLTGIVTKLQSQGQLTVENVTAAVQAYAELVAIQDNLSDSDKVIESAAKIVEMFTGSEATASQIDGVTAIITDILSNGGTIDDCIAEIVEFLNSSGAIDAEANITKMDVDKTKTSALDVDGSMKITDIEVPDSLKSLDDVTAYITDLAKTGNLSVSDVTGILSQLTKNGTLSVSDITGVLSSLSKNGTLSVSDITGVLSSLTKSGTLTVSDLTGVLSSLTKSGTLSVSDITGVLSSLTKSGTLSVSDITGVLSSLTKNGTLKVSDITGVLSELQKNGTLSVSDVRGIVSSLTKDGTLSLSSISASVSSLSKSGSPSLSSISASVSSLSKSGSPSLSSISASVSSLSKSGSPSLSGIKATVSNITSNATTTLSNIKATIKSGGLSMASKTSAALKNITASVKSAQPASNKGLTLSRVTAAVSKATPVGTCLLQRVAASVSRVTKATGFSGITLSGVVRTSGTRAQMQMKSKGGIYRNGVWSGIPQYADGALNIGSLFIAGEAGPELVGHIGGQSEVLNQSQLAAVMKNAVMAGIANLGGYLSRLYNQMINCANGIIGAIAVNYSVPDTSPDISGFGYTTNVTLNPSTENGPELAQIVSLLNEIAENTGTPVEIEPDQEGIFRVTQKKAREYTQRTGNYAFV